MTPRMCDFVRTMNWHAEIGGPVLEIGSYIEKEQDHLDLRHTFPPGTPYVGVDVIDGPGVDRRADLLNEGEMLALVDEVKPKVILCLYVVEHVWEIREAARILGAMWHRNPESWLWVATHQNQPYHGTDKYPDYWRVTASGIKKLMEVSGIDDPKVFVLSSTTNPEDVLAIKQPRSMEWPGVAMSKTVRHVEKLDSKAHWEQYA